MTRSRNVRKTFGRWPVSSNVPSFSIVSQRREKDTRLKARSERVHEPKPRETEGKRGARDGQRRSKYGFLLANGLDQESYQSSAWLSATSSTRQKLPRRHLYCLRDGHSRIAAPRCLYKLRANSNHRVDFLLFHTHTHTLSLPSLRIFIEKTRPSLFTRDLRRARQSYESAVGRLQIAAVPRRSPSCANDLRRAAAAKKSDRGTKEPRETDENRRNRFSSVEGRTRSELSSLRRGKFSQHQPPVTRYFRLLVIMRSVDAVKSIVDG